MKKKHHGMILAAGFLLAAFLIAGSNFLSAKEKREIQATEHAPFWGLEGLGAAKNISPEKRMEYRRLINEGGLFIDVNRFQGEISRACGGDCNWCCCDGDGRNCRCCD